MYVAQAQGDVIRLLDTSPHDDCSSVDTDQDFPSADIRHAYTAPARAENVAPQREHERKLPSATPPRIYAAECPRHRTETSNTFIDGLRQLSDLAQHLKTFLGRAETQTGNTSTAPTPMERASTPPAKVQQHLKAHALENTTSDAFNDIATRSARQREAHNVNYQPKAFKPVYRKSRRLMQLRNVILTQRRNRQRAQKRR